MGDIVVSVSPGELIDKVTILEIKAERIEDQQKVANVKHELTVLTQSIQENMAWDDTLDSLKASLKQVNEELWEIEDDIRDCERNKDFSDTFIALARAVYVTNDKRAALKKDINLHLNSSIVEEKSYQAY